MQCPNDGTVLVMSERSGIEIDYCPTCRGVWLDRGELDKIIERDAREFGAGSQAAPAAAPTAHAAPQPPAYGQPAYGQQPVSGQQPFDNGSGRGPTIAATTTAATTTVRTTTAATATRAATARRRRRAGSPSSSTERALSRREDFGARGG